ncbi:hypothetical protein [Mycolicibacter kumamotonensis]|nr:hypothetical protein [Mycolicibacter kumamotonensis]
MGLARTVTVSEGDLHATIASVLADYPWFADYRSCHDSCARWRIADEYGDEAGRAWGRYSSALWLLTGLPAHKAE